jgi:TonB family protein
MTVLLSVAVALAAAPGAPSGWEWDQEAPICVLRQQVPTQSASIEVRRTPGNDETVVRLVLPVGSKIGGGTFRDGEVTLEPGGRSVAGVVAFRGRDGRPQLQATTPDPTFIQHLASATMLEISQRRIGSVQLPIASAADALDALQHCEDSKMLSWGVDPRAWRALQARPQPYDDPRNRFTADDYPRDAVAQHIEADAITRVDVSAGGDVIGCKQLNAGSYRGFEQAACRVMKRARFRPARDANGQSVSAPIMYDVVFRLPF